MAWHTVADGVSAVCRCRVRDRSGQSSIARCIDRNTFCSNTVILISHKDSDRAVSYGSARLLCLLFCVVDYSAISTIEIDCALSSRADIIRRKDRGTYILGDIGFYCPKHRVIIRARPVNLCCRFLLCRQGGNYCSTAEPTLTK